MYLASLPDIARNLATSDARVQLTNLTTGNGPVPASSLSRVATLGARQGHQVEVSITGSQAAETLEQILALAARNFDEPEAPEPARSALEATGPVIASPGIAIGPACRVEARRPTLPDHEPGDPTGNWRRLREAIAETRRDLSRTRARVSRETGEADAAIFDAHLMLLDDTELLGDARGRIDAGVGAARAWHDAVTGVEEQFGNLDDSYLRGRAADVRAVGDQVLRRLLGLDGALPAMAGILVAADLAPADAADLDTSLVRGVVLAHGSPTSHAAILATAKGITMLVAAGSEALAIADGTRLVVNADRGELIVDPTEEVLGDYERRLADRARRYAVIHAEAALPAVTRDGRTIPVNANLGSLDDAKAAADAHADRAGLVRTEFLFHARSQPPTIHEQEAIYRAITDAFAGRRVVFRTLDAGGDKPLAFAPVEHEANPFLGIRGIRLSLRHPELLLQQVQAICAVAADAPVSVMFPMVSTLDELLAARALVDEACGRRRPDGLRIGIMVEVPAVALKAAAFARTSTFSVGTNDLTQYALAAERGNPALAASADPLDPGVLGLIAELCRARRNRMYRSAARSPPIRWRFRSWSASAWTHSASPRPRSPRSSIAFAASTPSRPRSSPGRRCAARVQARSARSYRKRMSPPSPTGPNTAVAVVHPARRSHIWGTTRRSTCVPPVRTSRGSSADRRGPR
jgi:phosphocarrier protein FPr